jgi:retron-type reverse transcriptase
MSYSPRLFQPRPLSAPTVDNVNYHDQSARQFVYRTQHAIWDQVKRGRTNVTTLADDLLPWIADFRNLRCSWDYLAANGGECPGPNGLTYSDLSRPEVIVLLKQLESLLLVGEYRPGPERRVTIPKSSGNGTRKLTLQNIQDRVVARACVQILQPLLRGQFRQLDYTASGNRQKLLALAEMHSLKHGSVHFAKNDIQDAFDRVPQNRLMSILEKYITSPPTVELIHQLTSPNIDYGLRQGSPMSPLLMDLYLDHFLVRRWSRDNPNAVLLKYVDDLLVLCPTAAEASEASHNLRRRLRESGFDTKYSEDEAVGNLTDARTEWLGMDLSVRDGRFQVLPGERTWLQLQDHLSRAQDRPTAPGLADQIIAGWANQLGPCYESCSRPEIYQRVHMLAGTNGFDEIVPYEQFHEILHNAYLGWQGHRATVRRRTITRPRNAAIDAAEIF